MSIIRSRSESSVGLLVINRTLSVSGGANTVFDGCAQERRKSTQRVRSKLIGHLLWLHLLDFFAGELSSCAIAVGYLFGEVIFDGASDEHNINLHIGAHLTSAFLLAQRNNGDCTLK